MRIGKFRKSPGDRKRYEVNYDDWLNLTETITEVQMSGNNEYDAFYVDGYIVTGPGKEVVFYVSGGVSGATYEVGIKISTSLTQIKEDTVTFVVT